MRLVALLLFLTGVGCSNPKPTDSTDAADSGAMDTEQMDSAAGDADTDADSDTDTDTDSDSDTDTDSGQNLDPNWYLPFNKVTMGGTHNSYEVERGTLKAQLDAGVRCIELDIHDNDYSSVGDYQLGHDRPGDAVATSENGVGVELSDWLELVQSWSKSHPQHAPITVVIDLKDNLTDNSSSALGNLGALNLLLKETFGNRLFLPEEVRSGWPRLVDMQDKILVQISGDSTSRARYLRDPGERPAVAMNGKGQVIEVHDSGSGSLWFWTGQMQSDGAVVWHHHGRYDSGMDPAVAIDDDGWIVEVHKSESRDNLWAHVAYLNPDYTVSWGASQKLDGDGVEPSVSFVGDALLTEIHRVGSNTSQKRSWKIEIDRADFRLSFDDEKDTTTSRFIETIATSAAGTVEVKKGSTETTEPTDTLLYRTDRQGFERIRYQQLAFVDFQPGNDEEILGGGVFFYNTRSGTMGDVDAWRDAGWVVRLWGFSEGDVDLSLNQPNCPATDGPKESWYAEYLRDVAAPE